MAFLLVLFSAFVLIDAYDRTPHRFEVLVETFQFGDYRFTFYSKVANWAEAHTICQATGSRLAVVNTPERAKFLADALSQTKTGFEDVWIGGRFSKDTWLWISSGKAILPPSDNFPPWLSYPTKRGKHCLSLDRKNHRDPIFVELKCNLYRPFVCENSARSSINKFPEQSNEVTINNRHYYLYHGRVTWQEALAFCKQSESRLATIPNLETATQLVELMKRARPPFENVWIGAKRDYAGWMWIPTEEKLADQTQKGGFPPWRFDTPSDDVMKSCVILDHHPCLNPYHIHVLRLHRCEEPVFIEEQCGLKKDFLCEVVEDERNEDIIQNIITIDKMIYIFYETAATWFEADKICTELNMSLAMPETPRQWETIVTHMGDMPRELFHVWLGGRWNGNKWMWWNDNKPMPLPEGNNTFPPWCLSMEFHEEDEDCINLDRDSHNMPLIYGYNCSMKQSFVCELDGEDFINTPSNPTEEFQYNRNNLTFMEAEFQCKLNNSDLAVVNTTALAQMVALLVPRDTLVWVGGQRMLGIWRWKKTKEIIPDDVGQNGYPPWESSISPPGKSLCLAMKVGYREEPFFVEKPCQDKLNYICQYEQQELPQPDLILNSNEIGYFFYKRGVTWSEAMAICHSGNLHLVAVGNVELGNFLISAMTDRAGGTIPVWTSGKQQSDGSWAWITSGSKLPKEIELNNTIKDLTSVCVQLNKSTNNLPIFEGEDCLQNRSFVCADKMVIQNKADVDIDNKSLSLQDIITNIEKAKKICTDNGKIPMDVTKLDHEHIRKLMKTENVKSLWVFDVIRNKDGKWVYANTSEEYKTDINFTDKDNQTTNDLQNCLTLSVTPDEQLILIPSLCSDFSRMICVAEVNQSVAVTPPEVENNDKTIIAILENRIIEESVLRCVELGGNIIWGERIKEAIEFFKGIKYEEYKKFWLGATYVSNSNGTANWMWTDKTPVNLTGLPDVSQADVDNNKTKYLIYNRDTDKMEAVSGGKKYSTVCDKAERKCEPKKQKENKVIWPDKCISGPVSGGTVCTATCPPDTTLIGIENHNCFNGKWSDNGIVKCEDNTYNGKEFHRKMNYAVKEGISFFLFVLDYGVSKATFKACLQFTRNLANTILLSDTRRVSIEIYSYASKTIDIMENKNCYLLKTIDELERISKTSTSAANYYSAFVTAEEEFASKTVKNGFIFFFALRPDKGSMEKMEIIKRLKEKGVVIIIVSIGNEIERTVLEEIASTQSGQLQLYAFPSLKGLIEASTYLRIRAKIKLKQCHQ